MKTVFSEHRSNKRPRGKLLHLMIGLTWSLSLISLILCSGHQANSQSYPSPPVTLVDDSVPKTVQAAAAAGWVPCPGTCLKLATPGWQHKKIEGFPDTDVWMVFNYSEGWQAFSQRHIGHIIRTYPDKPAEDTGNCPICNGTGWVRHDKK